MGIGQGLVTGTPIERLVGVRPGDAAYDNHSGATYHPQDESGNGNIAFYEIQNTGDQLDFDLGGQIANMAEPCAVLRTVFGETDFAAVERGNSTTTVETFSGFDSDVWVVELAGTDGRIRVTQFDTGTVSGTQAGWYPYIGVFDARVE